MAIMNMAIIIIIIIMLGDMDLPIRFATGHKLRILLSLILKQNTLWSQGVFCFNARGHGFEP